MSVLLWYSHIRRTMTLLLSYFARKIDNQTRPPDLARLVAMCSWITYDVLPLLSTKCINATFISGVECYIKDKKISWSLYLHIRISCTCNLSNWPMEHCPTVFHYNDVIMSASASPITSLTIVYSTVYSLRSKKTSNLRVTGLCEGDSPVTGELPAQRASNAENVSIWWRHHAQRHGFV